MILTYQLLYLVIVMSFVVFLAYKLYSVPKKINLKNFVPFIGLLFLYMLEIIYLVQEFSNIYVWWVKDLLMILCAIWILIIGSRGTKK